MLRKFFLFILVGLVLGAAGTAWYVWRAVSSGTIPEAVVTELSRQLWGQSNTTTANLPHQLLGYEQPQTYLVLFLNNTELRPGGGFIGSYAVVRLNHGHPELLAVEGSEAVDARAPKGVLPKPPEPIREHLKVPSWFFRDSNWSPDFALSSRQTLELYTKEGGPFAADIDGIFAFTPTVIEELLKITGPITVDGQVFKADGFTAQLEYEVEKGYAQRGIPFKDRKAIVGKIGVVLLESARKNILTNFSRYYSLVERLATEKHLLVYFLDKEAQAIAESRGWAGRMAAPPGDFLLWADANLGALKTDAVMTRSLDYSIAPTTTGLLATARMTYKHNQKNTDWSVSRYLSYARIFVPAGSTLQRVFVGGVPVSAFATGTEAGHAWFGTFITVEPGQSKVVSFDYALPKNLVPNPTSTGYSLLVQKQIGTAAIPLTADLNFGKPMVAAAPPSTATSSQRYQFATDLRLDRIFTVRFK